jgi:hypothetical protein
LTTRLDRVAKLIAKQCELIAGGEHVGLIDDSIERIATSAQQTRDTLVPLRTKTTE